MYWLIETEEQINYLINRQYKEAFIEIIPFHKDVHPALNDVSLVYFKPSIENKGFMLCITHSECLGVSKTLVDELLTQVDKLWVRDKKSALFYFQIKALLDSSILIPPYIQEQTQAHNILYQKYPNKKDINKIVPIVKHYEVCEKIYETISPVFEKELPPYFRFYNEYTTLAFFGIEKNGIHINKEIFDQHFKPNNPIYSISDDKIYTNFNLFTTTKRPSNSYNGINFAALNKDSGARESFVPQNDKFVEIDISAYHPNLAAHLVDYEFGVDDVHQAFADMYGVDYKKAKELTFKQLYGGIFKEYEHLEFFQKVKRYIDDNWRKFNEDGYVEVLRSGYWLEKSKLDNMNPQKLFNYVLQNLETATNVCILIEINKLLRGKKSKIVLYTYDSFLFDIDESENLEQEINKIFKNKKLQTKTGYGTTYNF